MMHAQTIIKTVAAGGLAMSLMLAGCGSAGTTTLTEEQQANRAYMSQVNEAMAELDSDLESFVDAVSRGDVVNMRTQADNAYKSLDKLSELKAPEALADAHKGYTGGAALLREALDDYIALYSEADNAGDAFDWSDYDTRIAEIQKLYDKGVEALENADKASPKE